MPDTTPPALLSLRSTVILMIALAIAGIAGLLTYLTWHNAAEALLAAGATAGPSIALLNTIISDT